MSNWNMKGAVAFDEGAAGIIAHLLSGYYTTFTGTKVTVNGKATDGLSGWHADIYAVSGFTQNGTGFTGSIDHIDIYNAQNVLVATIDDIPPGLSYADLDTAFLSATAFEDQIVGTDGNDTIHALAGWFVDGGSGNDTLVGSDGDDQMFGNLGANSVSGNGGDDLIAFIAGDTVNGGSGSDWLVYVGAAGAATVDGGADFDLIDFSQFSTTGAKVTLGLAVTGSGWVTAHNVESVLATSAADTVYGSNGDDLIATFDGSDSIRAGGGNDLIDAGTGMDTIDGGDGSDEVDYSASSYGLTVDLATGQAWTNESDTLTGIENIDGTHTDDRIYGNDSANTLISIDGNDILDGRGGADTLEGGYGSDTYFVDNAGDIVIDDGGDPWSLDTEYLSVSGTAGQGVEKAILTGTADLSLAAFADTGGVQLTGNSGANRLTGNDGDNSLDGGAGADTMTGGAGNDSFYVDNANDVINDATGARDQEFASITAVAASGMEVLNLTGTDNISGTMILTSGAEIHGNSGVNVLTSGSGNDLLDGGAGADSMTGGTGNDSYMVDDAGDSIVEDALSGGTDTVLVASAISYSMGAGIENAVITSVTGATVHGNGLDNILIGSSAGDLLDGGAGADTMTGGDGNDTYAVDSAADTIVESLYGGMDTVSVGFNYVLTDNLEAIVLTGTGNLTAMGNSASNYLTGNAGNNVLDGAGGNDIMEGGAGDDSYMIDDDYEQVIEGANGGNDTVFSAAYGYALAENAENLTLVGSGDISGGGNSLDNIITGNAGDNTLSGQDGNDVLDGGGGSDFLLGGLGNDTYIISQSALIYEFDGEGTDTVIASINYGIIDSIENVILSGSADIGASGDQHNNALTGNTGNNSLSAEGGKDTLYGLDGNDRLDGGTNADAMYGGAGDDTYIVDNAGDVVSESGGAGTDTVLSSASLALGVDIENLTLVGNGALTGTGNALNNTLVGNSGKNTLYGLDGNDVLDGGSGSDLMVGGAGNDSYYVNNKGDVVTEGSHEGTDIVFSSISWTLGANVERLTLTGTNNTGATGNSVNNSLTGNDGNNHLSGLGGDDVLIGGKGNDDLNGGTGNDTMKGGQGDDVYHADRATDIVTEYSNQGTDTEIFGYTGGLAANVENLVLIGSANRAASGNDLSNTITGNAGSNTLIGMGGDDYIDGHGGTDTLRGGLGNDTYIVDSSDDVVQDYTNQGTDTVWSSISYVLGKNTENLTLTGSANITATGNGGANVLIGNSGDNVLTGGSGADRFVFNFDSGFDTITDFHSGEGDTIDLHNWLPVTPDIYQSGSSVVINFSYSSITVLNVTVDDVKAHLVW